MRLPFLRRHVVKRRLFWLSLMLLALGTIFLAPVLGHVSVRFAQAGDPAIPPVPAPVLTPQGPPPSVSAASAFLLDADSGDDAAVAIADGLAGSPVGFVQMMNQEALQLHLTHTHYGNVDGLFSDNHYTTAHELAVLARYALRLPLFAQIVQTRTYQPLPASTHQAHSWVNTNNLLWTYAGATGVKTGYTGDAGPCLVFSATRGGHHLIGVVLDTSTDASRFRDAQKLLDWGFGLPMRRQ